ncbi:MAG: DNA repair protein RecO [Candidatus Moranbacteria bacterium]|nr:DNA repair protein RecO [Candidatus Moranbacteria bacterium]
MNNSIRFVFNNIYYYWNFLGFEFLIFYNFKKVNLNYKTQGIILNKYKTGDYDGFYVALTKDFGKVNFFAKSSRKNKAKLTYHLEPGSLSDLYFVPRIRRESFLLTGADLLLKPSFEKLGNKEIVLYNQAINLTSRLVSFEIMEVDKIFLVFDILKQYLTDFTKLSKIENNNEISKQHRARQYLFQAGFILKLLDYAGFRPNLKQCNYCGKKISAGKGIFYDLQNSVLTCCTQRLSFDGIEKVSFDCLKLTNFLLNNDFDKMEKVKVEDEIVSEVWRFSINHLKYCL